jgi:hypothetical protein
MASTVFPIPVAATPSFSPVIPYTFTAVAPNTLYGGLYNAPAGTYTITCASGTVTKVDFYLGTTFVVTASTSSGTVTVNLATPADRVRLFTNTGTNILITITQTGNALVGNISGVLDTITTVGTSTYTGTSTSGFGYAILVGGGGGGQAYFGNPAPGGGGGGASAKEVELTGSMAVTIGAGGARGLFPSGNGTSGGTSTFGGMTCTGGGGGNNNSNGGGGGSGSGGTVNTNGTSGAQGYITNPGSATYPTGYPFVVTGLSGYGNGGAGGGSGGANGNNGTQGVLYVLRF